MIVHVEATYFHERERLFDRNFGSQRRNAEIYGAQAEILAHLIKSAPGWW
jgi:hypothetical protein